MTNKAAQELGRAGGKARAAKLTREERSEACRKAARARWARWRAKRARGAGGGEENRSWGILEHFLCSRRRLRVVVVGRVRQDTLGRPSDRVFRSPWHQVETSLVSLPVLPGAPDAPPAVRIPLR